MVFKFALLCASIVSVAAIQGDDVLITRTPFIMTHDAATGYLGRGVVNAWTKTQSTSFAGQLDCGARAFDARPRLDPKLGLIWHHGGVAVKHALSDSLSEIIAWCNNNPSELVILPFSSCDGDGCMDALASALASANIVNLQNCSGMDGLTYGVAKTIGALPGGGALLAFTGPPHPDGVACSYGNYDSSQGCFNSGNSQESDRSLDCWQSPESVPMDRMLAYLDGVSVGGLSDTAFTQFQALWQETPSSVTIGSTRYSSLLKDEQQSGLNAIITSEVLSGRWPAINMLEVNNVCDGGLELLAALRKVQTVLV